MKRLIELTKTGTLKDSSISLVGHIASALTNAFFFAFAARLLGPESFGIFSLSLISAMVAKDLVDLSLDAAIMRFIPVRKDTPDHLPYLKHIFLSKLFLLGTLAVTVTFLSQPLSLLIFKQSLPALIAFTAYWSLTQSILSFTNITFQAKRMFVYSAAMMFAQPLLRLTLFFFLAQTSSVSVINLVIVSILADITITFLGLLRLTPGFFTSTVTQQVHHQVRRFATPLIATSVSGTLSDKVNLYITNYYSTIAQVGFLSAASRLFLPVQSISGSLSGVFGSRYASFTRANQARPYLKKSLALTSTLALGLLFSIFLAKYIILIFYGQEFLSSVPVFQVFAVGFAIFLFQVPLSSYLLYFLGRSSLMAVVSIVQLGLTIITNLILIPRYGIIGAAYSFVITLLVSTTLLTGFVLNSARSKPD